MASRDRFSQYSTDRPVVSVEDPKRQYTQDRPTTTLGDYSWRAPQQERPARPAAGRAISFDTGADSGAGSSGTPMAQRWESIGDNFERRWHESRRRASDMREMWGQPLPQPRLGAGIPKTSKT
jgi:hypothetical protein